jgi:hypothetical protein
LLMLYLLPWLGGSGAAVGVGGYGGREAAAKKRRACQVPKNKA